MSGFSYKESNGLGYFAIDEFEDDGAKTCFSARLGGISPDPYSSLNLGYKSGDAVKNVDDNFDVLCSTAGFKKENLVLSDQVHGIVCRVIGEADRGKGIIKDSDIREVDAMVTNARDTALCIFTADCVPVFLFDRQNMAVGLCHAGWRGIVSGIIPETVSTMRKTYGTLPENLIAAIGPSIGPCCFNVGPEVAEIFEKIFKGCRDIIINKEGRYKIDLWNAAISMLYSAGLNPESIINSGLCTSCRGDLLYSYRRDGAKTGRMVSIIQLS